MISGYQFQLPNYNEQDNNPSESCDRWGTETFFFYFSAFQF